MDLTCNSLIHLTVNCYSDPLHPQGSNFTYVAVTILTSLPDCAIDSAGVLRAWEQMKNTCLTLVFLSTWFPSYNSWSTYNSFTDPAEELLQNHESNVLTIWYVIQVSTSTIDTSIFSNPSTSTIIFHRKATMNKYKTGPIYSLQEDNMFLILNYHIFKLKEKSRILYHFVHCECSNDHTQCQDFQQYYNRPHELLSISIQQTKTKSPEIFLSGRKNQSNTCTNNWMLLHKYITAYGSRITNSWRKVF